MNFSMGKSRAAIPDHFYFLCPERNLQNDKLPSIMTFKNIHGGQPHHIVFKILTFAANSTALTLGSYGIGSPK